MAESVPKAGYTVRLGRFVTDFPPVRSGSAVINGRPASLHPSTTRGVIAMLPKCLLSLTSIVLLGLGSTAQAGHRYSDGWDDPQVRLGIDVTWGGPGYGYGYAPPRGHYRDYGPPRWAYAPPRWAYGPPRWAYGPPRWAYGPPRWDHDRHHGKRWGHRKHHHGDRHDGGHRGEWRGDH
jgi:hypothetical protein